MLAKSNGKELTGLITRIILVVLAISGVIYAVSVMVAEPGNTFAEENKGLPEQAKHIQISLAKIAMVAEKLQDLPAQVEHNRKDLEELSGVKTDLALTIQSIETLAQGLGRIDKQVKQNTQWLINLR